MVEFLLSTLHSELDDLGFLNLSNVFQVLHELLVMVKAVHEIPLILVLRHLPS